MLIFAVRFFDTFFELPHQALAPELAQAYDERTNLLALRHFFLVAGGLGMTVLAYQVFLKERPDGTGGVLARDGYFASAAQQRLALQRASRAGARRPRSAARSRRAGSVRHPERS